MTKNNPFAFLREELIRQQKAEAVLACAILAGGGTWRRKTTLWKSFWKAHLDYMRVSGAELTDRPIVRLPNGPGPNDGDALLNSLGARGIVSRSVENCHGHETEVFTIQDQAAAVALIDEQLSEVAQESVRVAAEFFRDMTSKDASDWSHGFSREWRETRNGETMLIYRDLMSAEEAEELKRRTAKDEATIRGIFG